MSDQSPQPGDERTRQPVRVRVPNPNPYVTFAIMGLTILCFFLQNLLETLYGVDLLFAFWGKINSAILRGQVWRLVTPVLLHGSVFHIGVNMYALFIIGRRLERFYGHRRFLLLYLLSAFGGNTLSFVLSSAPSLGASTAVFGLMGAEIVFIYQNRKLFGATRTRQAIFNLGVILVINLTYGFLPGLNIDNMGHIGGFIGGLFFAWKGGPLLVISREKVFADMVDSRRKSDVLLATLVVMIGFIIIASIKFFST